MYYDEEGSAVNFLLGLLVGAAAGAAVALLVAPQSGKRTRRQLFKAVSSARDNATERLGDLSDDVRTAVEAGRKRIRV
jgi:gas vesicle protein